MLFVIIVFDIIVQSLVKIVDNRLNGLCKLGILHWYRMNRLLIYLVAQFHLSVLFGVECLDGLRIT